MLEVGIYGAGGLGMIVHDILTATGIQRPTVWFDSHLTAGAGELLGLPLCPGHEAVRIARERALAGIVVAVGFNQVRVEISAELAGAGISLLGAIHPLAMISRTAMLSGPVIVGPRAIISTNARIAEYCVISAGSIIEHDNHLDRGVFIHPAARLAGGVHVREMATVGIGAIIIPGRTIGNGAVVRHGSVVIRDVADGSEVGGVPALACDEADVAGAGVETIRISSDDSLISAEAERPSLQSMEAVPAT